MGANSKTHTQLFHPLDRLALPEGQLYHLPWLSGPVSQDSLMQDAKLEERGYTGSRSLLNAMTPAYARG